MNNQPDWDAINAKKREEILYSQSWNLSAQIVASHHIIPTNEPAIQAMLDKWQKYFYDKLMRKEKVEEVDPLKYF